MFHAVSCAANACISISHTDTVSELYTCAVCRSTVAPQADQIRYVVNWKVCAQQQCTLGVHVPRTEINSNNSLNNHSSRTATAVLQSCRSSAITHEKVACTRTACLAPLWGAVTVSNKSANNNMSLKCTQALTMMEVLRMHHRQHEHSAPLAVLHPLNHPSAWAYP